MIILFRNIMCEIVHATLKNVFVIRYSYGQQLGTHTPNRSSNTSILHRFLAM